MSFNNDASRVGFIGDYSSIDEVIAADRKELEEIGGSFEAIADRMDELIEFAERMNFPYDEWSKVIDPVIDKFNVKYGGNWHRKNIQATEEYGKEWSRLRAEFPQTRFDEKVSVVNIIGTRGFQLCPFEGCDTAWSEDVAIYNRETCRELKICLGTSHLAREHHLIEKGNEYGISAKEFYEHFMP